MQIIKFISLIAISAVFIIFGVHLLVGAYDLNDPFSFVITFFASNLMILISASLMLGFIIKLFRHCKTRKSGN